ncbi:hypothetical protein [Spiroplasma endosymbiont of Amphimallon solstitiale]|uniref:hypothetical protein n=1 Tax=Spiroplasma endosymbiont of Amphimallon solstitiale TaxID=3066288 RepID=UPI00313D56F6
MIFFNAPLRKIFKIRGTCISLIFFLSHKIWVEFNSTLISYAEAKTSFNYVEKYGWPKIIHQFTLKILFLIKNLLKVTLFSVKIL